MQGDAMKEQSDANTAVFVWGVIMHLCMHMFVFSKSHIVRPCVVTNVTLVW